MQAPRVPQPKQHSVASRRACSCQCQVLPWRLIVQTKCLLMLALSTCRADQVEAAGTWCYLEGIQAGEDPGDSAVSTNDQQPQVGQPCKQLQSLVWAFPGQLHHLQHSCGEIPTCNLSLGVGYIVIATHTKSRSLKKLSTNCMDVSGSCCTHGGWSEICLAGSHEGCNGVCLAGYDGAVVVNTLV